MPSIQPTPEKAPYPATKFLKLSAREDAISGYALSCTATDLPCRIPVHVGLFFDGTNNNMYRDLEGRRVPVPLSKQALKNAKAEAKAAGKDPSSVKPKPIPKKDPKPDECSHSNVARLFQAFPWDKQASGYHPFYIQGVGTEFHDIGEPTESQEGKAFAKGGLPRIIWGLFQVLNAIHATVHGADVLYKNSEVGNLAQSYDNEVGRIENSGPRQNKTVTHKDWFAPHLAKLKAALEAKPKPHVPSLTVYVFGFSRGAAEAVAFCHLFDQLLEAGKLAGISATIRFVGLFDVVASVGGSASVARTLPLPGAIFDGHWAWANYVDNPIPGCVEKGLHCIAAHEMRMNFPVTRIEGGAVRGVYFPGAHSDVGGGYPPGDQGKGRGTQAALLSQIPLAYMYKEARLAGVPLVSFSELPQRRQMDFEVDATLGKAWEAYTSALNGEGDLLKKHMELFYRWRATRLNTLDATASFQAASAQDQQDLMEANAMLTGDLEAIRHRRDDKRDPFPNSEERPVYGPEDGKRVNQWHLLRANNRAPLDEWERWAMSFFDKPKPLPPEVEAFFDDYVHDSFAGFYMAGEVTEFDKRKKVEEVLEKDQDDRDKFEKKVFEITAKTKEAKRKKDAGEPLRAEEERLLKEAETGTPYPTMTDGDAVDMRSPAILTQTSTRREGGGYIIRRGYYPHEGFFLRKSKHENELQRAPSASLTPGQQKAVAAKAEEADEQAPREFVWSNNLRKDIPQELMKTATYKEVATA
ncbi:T6SS phospholipase effector Tle1-like catalytic domain-containing protein [Dechloromonas denitrificans]|uniref:T6SS phospholipase effector Tle1-like catalytic domain-containing protein n=1 Tax=Dechloromonas denitrificans TaxID=281362 RepID=UPI0009F82EE4|nr:DUF2235 domain-containing protein [Dechloromonas denitrificans]